MIRQAALRWAWRAMVVTTFAMAVSCGDSGAPAHADTGAGAGETPPATVNCMDLCLRGVECVAKLCDEDTMSTRYDALSDVLAAQCPTSCAGADVSTITPTQWQCLFQSSCRQVFEHDVCHAGGHYSCTSSQ